MAQKEQTLVGSIIETFKTIIYALLIAGVFRTFLFQPFWIPSGSMKDTLLIGDFLFVNKMAYGYSYASCPTVRIPAVGLDLDAKDFCGFAKGKGRLWAGQPERGDVVVFRHPVDGRDFIKRVVGLPGDKIQVTDGQLILNDVPVPQQQVDPFIEVFSPQGPQGHAPRCSNGVVGRGGLCEKERFIETLPNGVKHSILNIGDQRLDNTPVYTVPEGHYFFMGDNRDNSTDSRVAQRSGGVGYVPFEDIVGRADRVIFSSGGRSMLAFWTWRGDRFFEKIE